MHGCPLIPSTAIKISKKFNRPVSNVMKVNCTDNVHLVSVSAAFLFLPVLLEYLTMPYQQACTTTVVDFIKNRSNLFFFFISRVGLMHDQSVVINSKLDLWAV